MISSFPSAEGVSMGTPDSPADADHVSVYRTPTGWRVAGVGGDAVQPVPVADDLLSALVLADLLGADLAPGAVIPGSRPVRPPGTELDEAARLRIAVQQLEHALAARVVVEQAIGVLAERSGTPPRDAFENLRRVARSRGRKVHELSREVVASVTDGSVVLPEGIPTRRP
jgi:hypothetical protein